MVLKEHAHAIAGRVAGFAGAIAISAKELLDSAPPPPAQVATARPSVADVVMAQNIVAWLTIIGVSLIGAMLYYWRRDRSRRLPTRGRIISSVGSSLSMGVIAGAVVSGSGLSGPMQLVVILVFSFGAEWILDGAEVVFRDVGRNPWRYLSLWFRDLRRGRAVRLNEEARAEEKRVRRGGGDPPP